jgi:hypothetical protein
VVVAGGAQSGRGGLGGIVKDPAIETAATALLVGGGGIQDALESLAAHPDDWLFRVAIISKATELDKKRRREEIEALGVVIGAEVGKVIGKMFGG